MKVYEICDITDGDMYHPLGIFASLEELEAELKAFDDRRELISEQEDGFEIIAIIERSMGWSGHGRTLWEIEREECYDAEEDEYYWRTVAHKTGD